MSEASIDTDFAREYDVRGSLPAFDAILADWGVRGRAALATANCQRNLHYGPAAVETLDYFPVAKGKSGTPPLMIFLHGGFWRRLGKEDFGWLAPPFVSRGIAVAIVDYGLAPSTALEEIVAQSRRSVAWLHKQAERLGFDRDRLVVAGHSAGGHLSAMMLATDWTEVDPTLPARPLAGGIALSPLADLAPLAQVPELHADLDFTPWRIASLSPARLPQPAGIPLLGSVGGLESREFKRQLAVLAAVWPDCWAGGVDMPECDHLSLCEAFAAPESPLFEAAIRFVKESARRCRPRSSDHAPHEAGGSRDGISSQPGPHPAP